MGIYPEQTRTCEFNGEKVMYWNTGRAYTANGQRMAAIQIEKDVLFIDLSRNIEGVIENCPLNEMFIMEGYDKNKYRGIATQDEYCVQRDVMFGEIKLDSLFA